MKETIINLYLEKQVVSMILGVFLILMGILLFAQEMITKDMLATLVSLGIILILGRRVVKAIKEKEEEEKHS